MNATGELRKDYEILAECVPEGARVLDIGCGTGGLLDFLRDHRGARGLGIDLKSENVSACLSKRLNAIQGDAEVELANYPAQSFDVAILSQTLQALTRPHDTLDEMLRVADTAIVTFPNFGHWRLRGQLLWRGCMPVTEDLAYEWYDTPNIHFCTIRDFVNFCDARKIVIREGKYLNTNGDVAPIAHQLWRANLLGKQAIFTLARS